MKHIPAKNKTKTLRLARQASGTVAKVIKMIEDEAYCPEIMQQVDSAIGLLRTVKRELLAGHLDTCVLHRLQENKKQTIEELLKIYNSSK